MDSINFNKRDNISTPIYGSNIKSIAHRHMQKDSLYNIKKRQEYFENKYSIK